jgi:hypothetical protein
MTDAHFGGDDLVFTKNDGVFVGGGYKINSFFLNNNVSPLTTYNNKEQNGDDVGSQFKNLAIPAGLYYATIPLQENRTLQNIYHETASDDLMDKLYSLVEYDKNKQRKTKKNKNKFIKKTTRKQI